MELLEKEEKEEKEGGERRGGAWREGRKERSFKKSSKLWQEQVLFGDHVTVHNFSWVPMRIPKERKTRQLAIPLGQQVSL